MSSSTTATPLIDACCTPGPAAPSTSAPSFPSGMEVKLGGVDCYSVNERSAHLVVFCTDVFGWRFPKSRQVADHIAASGFHVVVPDMFDGDAVTAEQAASRGMAWVLSDWLPRHPREERATVHEAVVRELKQRRSDIASVQAIGYCYGAPGVLLLYDKGLATSGVVAHPSGFTNENVGRCSRPTLFNCAQSDPVFTPEIWQHWQQAVQSSKFVDYPGTAHGFAVRDDGTAEGLAAKQRSTEETIAWLKQHAA